MPPVFAQFSDPAALEQTRLRFSSSKVIPGQMQEPEAQTHEGHGPLDSNKLVEGHTLGDELVEQGLPAEQSRMFADALRSGSSLLLLEGDPEDLRKSLIEAGAGYVSGV